MRDDKKGKNRKQKQEKTENLEHRKGKIILLFDPAPVVLQHPMLCCSHVASVYYSPQNKLNPITKAITDHQEIQLSSQTQIIASSLKMFQLLLVNTT